MNNTSLYYVGIDLGVTTGIAVIEKLDTGQTNIIEHYATADPLELFEYLVYYCQEFEPVKFGIELPAFTRKYTEDFLSHLFRIWEALYRNSIDIADPDYVTMFYPSVWKKLITLNLKMSMTQHEKDAIGIAMYLIAMEEKKYG